MDTVNKKLHFLYKDRFRIMYDVLCSNGLQKAIL